MIAGKRVLVVEDEPIVALLLEDMLTDLGAVVVGPASNVARALAIMEVEAVDTAVLDVNLGHERSDAVAEWLTRRGTPFIYATGYGHADFSTSAAAVLVKPYRCDQLRDALSVALKDADQPTA